MQTAINNKQLNIQMSITANTEEVLILLHWNKQSYGFVD